MRFRLLLPLLPCLTLTLLAADPKPEPMKDLPDGTETATKRIPQLRMPKGMKAELWAAEPKLARRCTRTPWMTSLSERWRR